MQRAGTLRYVGPPRPGPLHHRPAWGNTSKQAPVSQVNRGPKKQGRSGHAPKVKCDAPKCGHSPTPDRGKSTPFLIVGRPLPLTLQPITRADGPAVVRFTLAWRTDGLFLWAAVLRGLVQCCPLTP